MFERLRQSGLGSTDSVHTFTFGSRGLLLLLLNARGLRLRAAVKAALDELRSKLAQFRLQAALVGGPHANHQLLSRGEVLELRIRVLVEDLGLHELDRPLRL